MKKIKSTLKHKAIQKNELQALKAVLKKKKVLNNDGSTKVHPPKMTKTKAKETALTQFLKISILCFCFFT